MDETRIALIGEFQDFEARHDYAGLFLNSAIALQIKALRQQRGWTQKELARRAGLHQSQVSEMEQVSHSAWSLRTLKRLAEAFDLALVVRYESFGNFLQATLDVSRRALERPSFPDDRDLSGAGPVGRPSGASSSARVNPSNLLVFGLPDSRGEATASEVTAGRLHQQG